MNYGFYLIFKDIIFHLEVNLKRDRVVRNFINPLTRETGEISRKNCCICSKVI